MELGGAPVRGHETRTNVVLRRKTLERSSVHRRICNHHDRCDGHLPTRELGLEQGEIDEKRDEGCEVHCEVRWEGKFDETGYRGRGCGGCFSGKEDE